jgi:hypothetical protein
MFLSISAFFPKFNCAYFKSSGLSVSGGGHGEEQSMLFLFHSKLAKPRDTAWSSLAQTSVEDISYPTIFPFRFAFKTFAKSTGRYLDKIKSKEYIQFTFYTDIGLFELALETKNIDKDLIW